MDAAIVKVGKDPDGAETEFLRIGARVRALLFDPLFAGRIPADLVLVPASALWGINLFALPGNTAPYLAEELSSLRIVRTERELIPDRDPPPGKGLLAVGGIDYASPADSLPSLRQSRREVEALGDLWRRTRPGEPCDILTGSAARESALPSRMAGRAVAHLSTHGFSCVSAVTGAPFTGLHLAPPPEPAPGDDGTWTELEIALEDFSTVRLVFLSSCFSAQGSEAAEDLAGLYRGFRLAGVRSAVLTPWKVGDRPSREWCAAFYRHFLLDNHGPDRAALETSSEILTARRSSSRPTHPYYWAGFVAVGY
jgi:CHAT domain-containing protein